MGSNDHASTELSVRHMHSMQIHTRPRANRSEIHPIVTRMLLPLVPSLSCVPIGADEVASADNTFPEGS